MDQGELEIPKHFLLHYLAFARLRLKYLSSLTCGKPGDIAEANINCLNKYIIDHVQHAEKKI